MKTHSVLNSLSAIARSLVRIRGHTVSTIGLDRQAIVIDAGAHLGEFSRIISDRFGCSCILIEPNPLLVDRLECDGFQNVISTALGPENGSATFYIRPNAEAGSVFRMRGEAEQTTFVEQMSLSSLVQVYNLSRIDLLKLDIEGSEFAVLQLSPDELLGSIRQITVEFHDFLQAFSGKGLFEDVRNRLDRLGFACCLASFRTHGDVLFLNRERFQLRSAAGFALCHSVPYWMKAREFAAGSKRVWRSLVSGVYLSRLWK